MEKTSGSICIKNIDESREELRTVEREALAVISDLQRFHQYLFGKEFALVSDHTPLVGLLGGSTPLLPMASSARIHRWAMIPVISCNTNQAGTLIMQMSAVDYPYNYR